MRLADVMAKQGYKVRSFIWIENSEGNAFIITETDKPVLYPFKIELATLNKDRSWTVRPIRVFVNQFACEREYVKMLRNSRNEQRFNRPENDSGPFDFGK